MSALLDWLARPENAKPLGLVILFTTFCLIVLWVYGSRRRGERLERYKHIPFLDEAEDVKDAEDGRATR
ncbi:MAG: cbb3-type cytochrome c oxidase subunit 3 [Thiobacillaceae bacterium]|nr:cbb3-type cytochrome c oxidase subunit 3 [Thiobacillaceae bacterium]MCX7672950.1 cbb3-type cytochrome c oxidase subunit 3 [Thiobacillaceae bacterium]MDW8324356.1 cbb3-type cytochrome c oxidase subunit 3 [Burkholderiales bacterium]